MTDLALAKAPAATARPVRARRWLRPALIAAGPLLLLLVGAYYYLTSGRYVSTDNAYVHAGITMVSTDIPGRVKELRVHENDRVRAGQILFHLKDASYIYALERAQAQLATARLEVEAMRTTYGQKQAELKAAQNTLDFQGRELERQRQLMATHVTSQLLFDQAQHNVDAARQNVDATRQALATILANLGGDPKIDADNHPHVLAAKAAVDQAQLDLDHTVIHAASDGIVAQVDKLQDGQYVTPGTPLFSLIGTNVWVEANFKETELAHVRPGQQATIELDTYSGLRCTGTVGGISPGTGAEFAVLPAQNATGNWVKVVQRVPVRISIDHCDGDVRLRSGMSATVEVDTKFRPRFAALIDRAFAGDRGDAPQ